MKNNYRRLVILSGELSSFSTQENNKRTATLGNCLKDLGINYAVAQGCYKGNYETSFICYVRGNEEVNTLQNLAFKQFGQESILERDASNLCYLNYPTGKTELIGSLEEVTSSEGLDAFTQLRDGTIWTVS